MHIRVGIPFLDRMHLTLQQRARAIIECRPDLQSLFDDGISEDREPRPDLNTWFLQWIDWIGVSAKFNLAWHYAWGGRGGFERIWTGPAAGVGRDGRAAARRCGHS